MGGLNTLFWFVISYWIISVLIGIWAGTRVKNAKDFAIAGRNLPLYMVITVVFATWFGSEAVLGIPATFLEGGIGAIIADPFGASLCLILFGLFLAVPLYRMNLLTIGDFYKRRYGRAVEVFTTLAIVLSYLGWVAAQITALGLVFYVVSGGAITMFAGMWIGSVTILIYTFIGGMWAVAVTDLLQMVIIVIGMLYIGGEIAGLVGGVDVVVNHAVAAGKFDNFWPDANFAGVVAFMAALMTMMFGSMPQQDVFQRAQSAKSEKIAKWGSVIGGSLYFCFAFIPLFLAYSAFLIAPDMVAHHMGEDGDSQLILPTLILEHAPLAAQILFFGALLSAIKSCASATLLAPSVSFTENILRPMMPGITDDKLLLAMRCVTIIFTIMVTIYAVNSESTIFEMVKEAYQVTLVTAFIPLVFGIFWKRATNQGAIFAIVCGALVWSCTLLFGPAEPAMPAQFSGLLASLAGMLVGSLMPQFFPHDKNVHENLLAGRMSNSTVTDNP